MCNSNQWCDVTLKKNPLLVYSRSEKLKACEDTTFIYWVNPIFCDWYYIFTSWKHESKLENLFLERNKFHNLRQKHLFITFSLVFDHVCFKSPTQHTIHDVTIIFHFQICDISQSDKITAWEDITFIQRIKPGI